MPYQQIARALGGMLLLLSLFGITEAQTATVAAVLQGGSYAMVAVDLLYIVFGLLGFSTSKSQEGGRDD